MHLQDSDLRCASRHAVKNVDFKAFARDATLGEKHRNAAEKCNAGYIHSRFQRFCFASFWNPAEKGRLDKHGYMALALINTNDAPPVFKKGVSLVLLSKNTRRLKGTISMTTE